LGGDLIHDGWPAARRLRRRAAGRQLLVHAKAEAKAPRKKEIVIDLPPASLPQGSND